MANSREILAHMNGIRDTMKITNAMYLIASSKLQKVRKHVAQVHAYFEAVLDTIGDVLACMPELDHPYLEAKDARQAAERKKNGHRHAYLIVTADKGLAGAYNLNVLKKSGGGAETASGFQAFCGGAGGTALFPEKTGGYAGSFFLLCPESQPVKSQEYYDGPAGGIPGRGDPGDLCHLYTYEKCTGIRGIDA